MGDARSAGGRLAEARQPAAEVMRLAGSPGRGHGPAPPPGPIEPRSWEDQFAERATRQEAPPRGSEPHVPADVARAVPATAEGYRSVRAADWRWLAPVARCVLRSGSLDDHSTARDAPPGLPQANAGGGFPSAHDAVRELARSPVGTRPRARVWCTGWTTDPR